MNKTIAPHALGLALAACVGLPAVAAETIYRIDPEHTFPSFEADHMGGLSVWRGKFNKTAGSIDLDKAAGTGSLDVRIDVASVDFGLDALNREAQGASLFDTAKYPEARYRGKLSGFQEGVPTQVVGELTLHGVTRPLTLQVSSFKCMPHPMYKREVCGADASASFKRDDYGMAAGKDYGFDMTVALRIQVEAIAEAQPEAKTGNAAGSH